jgi:hypothetical protein
MIMNMIKMSILLRLRDSRKSFGQGYVILIITLNFFFESQEDGRQSANHHKIY